MQMSVLQLGVGPSALVAVLEADVLFPPLIFPLHSPFISLQLSCHEMF